MSETLKVQEKLDILGRGEVSQKERMQAAFTVGTTIARATARIPLQQMTRKMKLNRLCKSIKAKYAIDDLDCNAFWHKVNPDTGKDQRIVVGVRDEKYLFILAIDQVTGEATLKDGYVYDVAQKFPPAPFPVSSLLRN